MMPTAPIVPKPSSAVLIAINLLAWFIFFVIALFRAQHPIVIIMLLIVLMVVWTLTSVGQLTVHFILRKRRIHPLLRTICFALPSIVLVAAVQSLPDPPPSPLNQTQSIASPSGQYILSVPISKTRADSGIRGVPVWKVTIRRANGEVEYKDEASEFVGYLNVYWVWDSQERAWLYNSDDGRVFFWEEQGGDWVKTRWGYGRTREIEREIAPPEALYPDP